MTVAGKLIGILGLLAVGLCIAGATYIYVLELSARDALPVEMQTAEMIQGHYDGEVVLLSITLAKILVVFAIFLAGLFGSLFTICESELVLGIEKQKREASAGT